MNTPTRSAIRTPQSSASSLSPPSEINSGDLIAHDLTVEDQEALLRLAHESILSAFEQREFSLEAPSETLAQSRGVFTSLYVERELRGCVGYVCPETSLYRAVAESARAAAFGDTRFSPVSKEEAPHLSIELSVLSPLQSIVPETIEVGRHGLLITMNGYRGLLLPQVAAEHGWDRTTFLEQACRKAGLPLNAWREGAVIEAFTAQVFGKEPGRL